MPYSSSAIHPGQKRSADENGRLIYSFLWLPSEMLVERNNPSTIWPIHRTIRYKIKQKSLLNSKLSSGPLCCQNNNINFGEQSQSRWERSSRQSCTKSRGGFAAVPGPLGQAQEVPFFVFCFFSGEDFYMRIHLNSQERTRARARLTELQLVKRLEFSSPRRFSEPTENQCYSWPSQRAGVVLHCSHLPSLWFRP